MFQLQRTHYLQSVMSAVKFSRNLEGTTDPTMIKYWHQVQKFHNEYITSCHSAYYAHRLESKRNLENVLSIVHDNMDKMKTSIPRMGRKEKLISTTYNLPVHLTSMITHGNH
jgi:hypothetical protein